MNKNGLYDGKAVIIQPREGGKCAALTAQDCKYNLCLRGLENGKIKKEHALIESISRCIDPYKDFENYMALAENADVRELNVDRLRDRLRANNVMLDSI
jgi:tagaturonate reductase